MTEEGECAKGLQTGTTDTPEQEATTKLEVATQGAIDEEGSEDVTTAEAEAGAPEAAACAHGSQTGAEDTAPEEVTKLEVEIKGTVGKAQDAPPTAPEGDTDDGGDVDDPRGRTPEGDKLVDGRLSVLCVGRLRLGLGQRGRFRARAKAGVKAGVRAVRSALGLGLRLGLGLGLGLGFRARAIAHRITCA